MTTLLRVIGIASVKLFSCLQLNQTKAVRQLRDRRLALSGVARNEKQDAEVTSVAMTKGTDALRNVSVALDGGLGIETFKLLRNYSP